MGFGWERKVILSGIISLLVLLATGEGSAKPRTTIKLLEFPC